MCFGHYTKNISKKRGIKHTSRANFCVNATQQSRQIQEIRMKIMVPNSGMKHESKTMLEVIRGLVLDFVDFVDYCMTKYLLYVISAESTA